MHKLTGVFPTTKDRNPLNQSFTNAEDGTTKKFPDLKEEGQSSMKTEQNKKDYTTFESDKFDTNGLERAVERKNSAYFLNTEDPQVPNESILDRLIDNYFINNNREIDHLVGEQELEDALAREMFDQITSSSDINQERGEFNYSKNEQMKVQLLKEFLGEISITKNASQTVDDVQPSELNDFFHFLFKMSEEEKNNLISKIKDTNNYPPLLREKIAFLINQNWDRHAMKETLESLQQNLKSKMNQQLNDIPLSESAQMNTVRNNTNLSIEHNSSQNLSTNDFKLALKNSILKLNEFRLEPNNKIQFLLTFKGDSSDYIRIILQRLDGEILITAHSSHQELKEKIENVLREVRSDLLKDKGIEIKNNDQTKDEQGKEQEREKDKEDRKRNNEWLLLDNETIDD